MAIAGIRLALTATAALCIAGQTQAQQFVSGPDPIVRGGAAMSPAEDPANWITAKDYPKEAVAVKASGLVVFRLGIGADGMVNDCTVIKSSGFKILDSTTCKLLTRRARFIGARDGNNEPAEGVWGSAVRWDAPPPVVTQ